MASADASPDLIEIEGQTEDLDSAAQIVRHEDQPDGSDQDSIVSNGSDDSEMEDFDTFESKIEQLLTSIGIHSFEIDPIQHGYGYQNCVYALTSPEDQSEQYILRVAIDGEIRISDERHETLENDIALLGYLSDKLPVPRVKAYSLTTDNVLGAAYTIQTRIPGHSLNNLWAIMSFADKYAIVDEYLHLLVKMESVQFSTAGTFAITAPIPAQMSDFSNIGDPVVRVFKPYAPEATQHTKPREDRTGSDLKTFLTWHLNAWIQEEVDRDQHELPCSIRPRFRKLLSMLNTLKSEGSFNDPSPIVLHHWDLEPRNIMVSKASGTWKITGIIDWDDALALPRPLSRVPPRWIWNFRNEDPELEDGFLNDDQYADPELSDDNKALKEYFDNMAQSLLPGYHEDAYGNGRWLRRIWHFAKEGAFRTWEWDFLDQIPIDWAARPQPNLEAEPGRVPGPEPESEPELMPNARNSVWRRIRNAVTNACSVMSS